MSNETYTLVLPAGLAPEAKKRLLEMATNLGATFNPASENPKYSIPKWKEREILLSILTLPNHTEEERLAVLNKAYGDKITEEQKSKFIKFVSENEGINPIKWFEIFYADIDPKITTKNIKGYDFDLYNALATQLSRMRKDKQEVPEFVNHLSRQPPVV